jgi:hypothetical protein
MIRHVVDQLLSLEIIEALPEFSDSDSRHS